MILLLLLFLLLPCASLAQEQETTEPSPLAESCPDNSACLLVRGCNGKMSSIADVSQQPASSLGCNGSSEPDYILYTFTPESSRVWRLHIGSSLDSLVGTTLRFGEHSLHVINHSSMEATINGTTMLFAIRVAHAHSGEKSCAQLTMEDETGKTEWLAAFASSKISLDLPASDTTVGPETLLSFWAVLLERTPCYETLIMDACREEGAFGSCEELDWNTTSVRCGKALWLNEGSAAEEQWVPVTAVACDKGQWEAKFATASSSNVEQRELICAAAKPVSCEPQEVRNSMESGHELFNVTRREVRCTARFWLATPGALSIDWQQVIQMRCVDGSWQWKDSKEGQFRAFEKQHIACSFDAPQRFTAAFFVVAIGGGGVALLVVVAVGLLIYCCVCRKRRPRKSRKSSSVSKTDMDTGEMSSLGVKVKPKKQDRTWSWSREEKKQKMDESSSNVSSIPASEAEEEKERGKRKSCKKQRR